MDIIDSAQVVEDQNLKDALKIALKTPAGAGEEPDWLDGLPYCLECGEAFPLARYKAIKGGTSLCAECAEERQGGYDQI